MAGVVSMEKVARPELAKHESSILGTFHRRLLIDHLNDFSLCLDLVFVMDCTGSMGSYITSATSNIRSIVEEIVVSEKSDIRLALVEYRDHPPQVSKATVLNDRSFIHCTSLRITHSSHVNMISRPE